MPVLVHTAPGAGQEASHVVDSWSVLVRRSLGEAGALVEIAAEKGVRSIQIAFAWILHQPGVTAPIVSVTKLEQLDDLIEASPSRCLTMSDGVSKSRISRTRRSDTSNPAIRFALARIARRERPAPNEVRAGPGPPLRVGGPALDHRRAGIKSDE